jgi:uncharacterized protein YggT (Ycf19 family)
MGISLAYFAYALTFVLHVIAFVLLLEWIFRWLPGAALNSIRRILFQVSFPFLKVGEVFGFRWGKFDASPLLMIVILLLLSRLWLPWLVLLSYTLRA